nr:MAG TPA: hypothetical protein [Caudoviricetes sp.]
MFKICFLFVSIFTHNPYSVVIFLYSVVIYMKTS